MSENNENGWEYVGEEDLISDPSFKRSNKAGYIEDDVDLWVKNTRQEYTDLANNYNEAVHQLYLSEGALKEANTQVATLTETNQRLMSSKGGPTQDEHDKVLREVEDVKTQYNELVSNYEALLARNAELEAAANEASHSAAPAAPVEHKVVQSFDREASAEDGYTYLLEYTLEGNIATVREFPHLRATGKNAEHALSNLMDEVDETLSALQQDGHELPQPGDYEKEETVSGGLDASKLDAIMKAAADEASEHIQRTQVNMARLEAAAKLEAASIVADANREAEESREELARNRAESDSIRQRMIMLFESQLDVIKNDERSIGYNPALDAGER